MLIITLIYSIFMVIIMRLIYNAILYLIEALIFEFGVWLVSGLKPCSFCASIISRFVEKIGDKMLCYEQQIKCELFDNKN